MAACRRVQLLLVFVVLCARIRSTEGVKSPGSVNDNLAETPDIGKNPGVSLQDGKLAAAAGASQPRRSTGWKLAEDEACREDLTRLCPKHSWNNNLAVLECLQDRKEVSGP